MLSEVARTHLAALSAIAPTLREAELRVLLHLTTSAAAAGSNTIRASSRELQAATKTARSNIVRAIDALAKRGLIAVRQGTPTRPAVYLLSFLQVTPLLPQRGPVAGPPAAAQTDLFQDHGGPVAGPPPVETTNLRENVSSVDGEGSLTLEAVIDRLARARPSAFDRETFSKARRWLHSYVAKFGRNENGAPHPPDEQIVAQFLAMGDGVGGWPRLEALLYELMAERKRCGYSYAWFISVAAQRVHGVSPVALKARREQIRLVKTQSRAAGAGELRDLQQRIDTFATRSWSKKR